MDNLNNVSCTITVNATLINCCIYPLNTPPSAFNNPTQANGIPNLKINTSIPLLKFWKYTKTY